MSVLPWERPLGATPLGDGRTTFRVWAPAAERVVLVLGGEEHELEDEGEGVRAVTLPAAHGARYAYRLTGREDDTAADKDDGERPDLVPDPASRHQPEGLRGPSAVVDPAAFAWTDEDWTGLDPEALVLYELHVGTFTDEGTFDAAIPHLAGLAELGVTAIELMPVAEFPGDHGWGYDGVYLSAAQSSYGGPEGLQRLVDAAHAAGLGVLLDVVYNHVGASGNAALRAYGPYFTDAHDTFWGAAVNYDDADCGAVREWVLQSAEGWIRDLHLDGLRIDAVHAIFDGSARHVLAELADRVHAAGVARGAGRPIVVAESALNDPKVVRPPAAGGWDHDAQWADDFHHAVRTLLTGEREGYYADFGSVADLAKAYRRPFVHDGTWSELRRRRYGAPADDRPVHQFVVFTTNHDQTGNRAFGDRLPAEVRPLAALLVLLSPFVPMLFMGEEHGEDAPFLFFSDHIDRKIADATREGRRREFAEFAAFSGDEVPDPQDPATFRASKLTRRRDERLATLYRDLLRARAMLPRGDVDDVTFDEAAGWIAVRRGTFTVVANFASETRTVPATASELVIATHDDAALGDGGVVLPARSGALLR